MSTAKFEIKKSTNGKFYFNLRSKSNGEIIATSEMYNSKQSCKDGISAVKRDAPNAIINDLT
ncbi:YegP family protein [Aquimarina sp. ERC-38]|uniref:YegP family protein n=1 Tax=Aquimarina sp. ERC-38 TaxID=2949996 RepID=UPI0022476D42|nr:YegP family protein [Aquimarina sp. ERC-38]UZO81538.1 YegP family protein [Aquimarina sp. ERC-38]